MSAFGALSSSTRRSPIESAMKNNSRTEPQAKVRREVFGQPSQRRKPLLARTAALMRSGRLRRRRRAIGDPFRRLGAARAIPSSALTRRLNATPAMSAIRAVNTQNISIRDQAVVRFAVIADDTAASIDGCIERANVTTRRDIADGRPCLAVQDRPTTWTRSAHRSARWPRTLCCSGFIGSSPW